MKLIFAVSALIVSVASNVPYIIEIVRGQAKPQRVSWLIWALLGGVYFLSTVFDTGATLYTFGELIGAVVILVLALKFGAGGKTRLDVAALLIAATALGLLFVVDGVLLSLLIALLIDGIGIVLTIRKLKIDPTSESRAFWAMAGIAGFLAVLSLESYSVVAMLFPVYVVFISLYVFLLTKKNGVRKIKVKVKANRSF